MTGDGHCGGLIPCNKGIRIPVIDRSLGMLSTTGLVTPELDSDEEHI